jgi:hypothetical protein
MKSSPTAPHSLSANQSPEGKNMTNQSRRAVGFLCSALAVAMLALAPSPALAGHGARHTPHKGSHQHQQKRGKSATRVNCAGGACTPIPSRAAPPSR